jgi:flavin reductase (DIM6/NTAB) family NADH-FMN oxidoreductase RutF
MSIDSRAFRDALSRFGSGVTVVSLRDEEGIAGITVSAFSSVSLEPPMVLVCIGHRSRALPRLRAAGRFGVSVLAADQQALSDRFAGRPDVEQQPTWLEDGWESPVLAGALAQLDCVVSQSLDAGDHTIFVAEVTRADTQDGDALAYWRGGYRRLTTG